MADFAEIIDTGNENNKFLLRLPDTRKGNRKHSERADRSDNLGAIKGPNELGRSSKLQPLPPNRSTRLPPLKSQRLPDIQTAQPSGIIPTPSSSKPEFDPQQTKQVHRLFGRDAATPKRTVPVKTHIGPGNETTNDRNSQTAIDRHKRSDLQLGKPNGYENKKSSSEHNGNRLLEDINPRSSRVLKDPRTKLIHTIPINHNGVEKEVTWQKERELLRKHRKQQAERMKVSAKPVKATVSFDRCRKESKMQFAESAKVDKVPKVSERQKIDLSVRRKCDDDEDWDWDNDIEEYMKIEEKEIVRQYSTSGTSSPSQNGGQRQQTPVILNCTKKGVGFKSKKKIEEEKQQEQAKVEKERKEKEAIEMTIPQKIRKNLKKYGFK